MSALLLAIGLLAGLTTPASAASSRRLGAAAMVEKGCKSHLNTVKPYPSDDLDASWEVGVRRNARFCRGGLRTVSRISLCRLGADKPRSTLALIGDSHSAHWRPAMDRAARAERLEVLSLVGSGCDLSTIVRMPFTWWDPTDCNDYRARIPRFLASRPRIKTVIMAQASYQEKGETAAYLRAWSALPGSVKRIITIVDNPRGPTNTYACLRRAIADRKRPGIACSLKRSQALKTDYAAAAARQLVGRQGRVIDFSDLFCDRQRCYPAIGGLLVYAQGSHQTPAFNQTLAPYLRRQLRHALS